MAEVGGLPGLSQLLAWPTDHLTEAADNWEPSGRAATSSLVRCGKTP
jgi:hypothetical protein